MLKVVHILSPTLIMVEYNGDRALWTSRTLRKPCQCMQCHKTLLKGSMAFGSLGNQSYRYRHACTICVQKESHG